MQHLLWDKNIANNKILNLSQTKYAAKWKLAHVFKLKLQIKCLKYVIYKGRKQFKNIFKHQ